MRNCRRRRFLCEAGRFHARWRSRVLPPDDGGPRLCKMRANVLARTKLDRRGVHSRKPGHSTRKLFRPGGKRFARGRRIPYMNGFTHASLPAAHDPRLSQRKESAMATLVGDFIIERLAEWGVHRIYGYPGDGINGLMGAMNRADGKIELVRARHEEMCAFMACAHAKFTGEVGVCMATSGPGAIHLLNGLYDAKLDHMPVVAIVGQQARAALGGQYQQEVDLTSLFKDVASEYVEMITVPAQVRHVVDRALRIAISKRAVTCIIVPNDLQELDAVAKPPRQHGTVHSGLGYSAPHVVPMEPDLRAAAELLNAGRKVAMLVGAGALGATDEVIEVADLLGAGAAKALLGKAVLPDDLPFVTGSIGLLGTKPSWDLMMECDTLLMVGSGFPYSEFMPKEGQARGVQIDIAPDMLSLRYPMEVNLVGDAAETLRALLPLLDPKRDGKWRQRISNNVSEWWKTLEERAMAGANPVNPQ